MATSKLPASLIQLAHQLQTFRRVGSSFTDEFDNETILFINFIATSTAEPLRTSGFAYPPAWDIDRATLHQAVRNLLQLGRRMNQDLQEEFYAWRRSQSPMPDRQPERPLGRVRPQSGSGSATSKPTNISGQEQQTQEPPSDLLQAQPKQTLELTSRPLETSSQPEGVPGSFPEGTPVSRSAASQSAPPIFSSLTTQPYIPPPNLFNQPLAYRQAPARGQESARRSLHRRSQPDLSRPVEPPIPEQPGPILRLSLEGPSPDPPQVDMGSRNEPEPGSGPPNPVQASSGPLDPAGSADLFGNLRALLREELQGHARDAAQRQNVFETAIRQDFERFQREMQRQMLNQNQHRIEHRQQDVHMSGGNDYPPYGQENDEFYTRECQRHHFSRDQRQPSVRGGSNGFQHPNERQRMPPPPPLDDDYDEAGSELTEANLGQFHWKTEDWPNQTSYQASRWPYQQAWTPWVPPPSRPLHPYVASNQATQGSQKIAGYFGNDQKQDQNERRGTQQNDRKPWNQWRGSAQQPAQPQPAQQAYLAEGMTEIPGPFPAYWSAAVPPVPYASFGPMPTPPLGGYYADAAEEPYQDGFVETESSDDNIEQLDHEIDSDSSAESDGDQALLAKAHTVAGTCHRCGKEFASRNALYNHLAGCQKDKTAPVSNTLLANTHDLPAIGSETNCLTALDHLYQSWRYLTASIGIHSKSHVDKDLHLEPQGANLIAVSGIDSLQESSKTVSFNTYIPGQKENTTPRTIIISRHSCLGYVADAKFAITAKVNTEHAYLAALNPAACILAAQTIDLHAERLATCNSHETPDITPNSPPPPEPPPESGQSPLRMTKKVPAMVLGELRSLLITMIGIILCSYSY